MSKLTPEMQEAIDYAVGSKVEKIRKMLVPHTCFTCSWFILRIEKPRNRVCRCPDKLIVQDGACQNWLLQEDPAKWVRDRNMGR